MSDLHDVGDIQVDENLGFLRKEWRFQHIGWIAMLLVIGLALTGALGGGPLSKAHSGDPETLAVSYERITRHGAETEMVLTAGNRLRGDTLRIYITAAYLQGFEVRDIAPWPISSGVRGGYLYYDFLRDPRSQSSEIALHLSSKSYWKRRAIVFTSGAEPLHVHQSILP